MVSELAPKACRQGSKGRLGRGIVTVPRKRVEAENGPHENHRWVASSSKLRDRKPHELRRRHEVEIENACEGVGARVTKRADRASSGRGHDQIEAAEMVHRGGDKLATERGIADVASEGIDERVGCE